MLSLIVWKDRTELWVYEKLTELVEFPWSDFHVEGMKQMMILIGSRKKI